MPLRISDKRRLIALIGILLLIGFSTTSLISYFSAARAFQREIREDILPLTSDNIYSEIQKDIVRLVFIASMMASDTFLRDWVLDGELQTSQLTKYLTEIKQQYGTVSSFFVSDDSRRYYYYGGILKTVSPTDPLDQWYFRVRAIDRPYEINLDPDMANKDNLTIFINYRVFDYKGEYIGATGCGLTVTSVQKLLDIYAEKYQRTIYFSDIEGNITLSSAQHPLPFSSISTIEPLWTSLSGRPAKESLSLTYKRDGQTYLLNTRYIPELNWTLHVEQPLAATLSRIRLTLFQNILLSIGITLIILLLISSTIRLYQRKLEAMATTDKLTQLINRHAFEYFFTTALGEAERNNQPLTIILFDIDRFKEINDRFGHAAGDAALVSVAATASEMIRKSDSLCRWGGEEFLLLLKDCSLEGGMLLAEKLRASIAETIIYYDGTPMQVEISLGVAQWQQPEDQHALLLRADQALYRAKENGRNRAEPADHEKQPQSDQETDRLRL